MSMLTLMLAAFSAMMLTGRAAVVGLDDRRSRMRGPAQSPPAENSRSM